jgi:hypothetical protein
MSGFAGSRLLKRKKQEQNTYEDFVRIYGKVNVDLVAGLAVLIGDLMQ